MLDSALFEALSSLSPWEAKAARRWLQSPAFTAREVPLRLFDFCMDGFGKKNPPACPDSSGGFSDLQNLLGTTDEKRIRRETSELLALLRDFFAWQELQKDPARREFYQLRAISRRGLEKNFQLALREAEKAKAAAGEATLARQFIDFQINLEKYHWDLSHHRGQEFPFEALAESLNAWYAGQLMQLSCMAQAQGAVQRQARAADSDWVGNVVSQLPGSPHETRPAVALYHLGHEMLARPEEAERVAAFRRLLETHIEKLPPDEARGLLMLAINHGIRRINAGEGRAVRNTLDFYLLGLQSQVLQDERGVLSKYTYNNVLMTFLALAEWDSARDFLEKYRPQLAAEERENVHRYNLAIYHFRRGDFDATLELLRDVSFPDPMYNLESRKMLLKIYFETGAHDALESLLENLLTWLRRHGELGYHREMYRNLAVFTGRLLRLAPGDREGRRRLAKKVADVPLVAERGWLLEIIGSG